MTPAPGASGVAGPPPAPAAPRRRGVLLAFAELRLRLMWRRFKGRGGIPELVARFSLFAIAFPAGLAFSALAGAGAWQAVRAGAPMLEARDLVVDRVAARILEVGELAVQRGETLAIGG